MVPGHIARNGTRKPPLEGRCLASAQHPRTPQVPGAVVAGEADQRVSGQPLAFDGAHHLAHAPVDLGDGITEVPKPGLAAKALRGSRRVVRVRERHVQEERIAGALLVDELHRLFGVARRQQIAVRVLLKNRRIAEERKRIHIVAIRNPEERIEAPAGRQKLRLLPQVPLANRLGPVTFGMKQLREKRLVKRSSLCGSIGRKRSRRIAAMTIAPRHHRGA